MSTSEPISTPERILQRLDWQVIRRLDGLLQGDYRSLFYGYGVDFADLREYQPEDDIRYIDWNVTARMNSPYTRQYTEEREITAWFLLDLSPSIDFGSGKNRKRDLLVDVVTILARLLTRHGNRVGAIFYGGSPKGNTPTTVQAAFKSGVVDFGRMIPARGGRIQVLHLVNDLLKQPLITQAPLTDLAPLLSGSLQAIKRRSLIFILSDFICAPGWERSLQMLAKRHEVLAVHLSDPREDELPDIGPIILEDAETGEHLYVDTHLAQFRQQFTQAAHERRVGLEQIFKRSGVDVLALSTDEDLVRAIVRFARRRQRTQRKANPPADMRSVL
jgi:uncharacterized protein (DUF58 family)